MVVVAELDAVRKVETLVLFVVVIFSIVIFFYYSVIFFLNRNICLKIDSTHCWRGH